jgi:protein toll
MTTVYRYRVKVFVRFNFHPFDVDECHGEDMLYDVFLSCAYEDSQVARQIVERLEQGDGVGGGQGDGYKVCYHERDFLPGSLITENIEMAIKQSKRVVCLLTRDFLHSDYCMMEFRTAWNRCLSLGKRRLVVVKWPDVDDDRLPVADDVPLLDDDDDRDMAVNNEEADETGFVERHLSAASVEDVRMFLSTHTYIDHQNTDWWQQLIYALPTLRISQQQQQ